MSDNIRNTDSFGIDLQTGYYDMIFADNAFNFRIVLKAKRWKNVPQNILLI